ncbi:MAG: hypothetical protein V2I82_09140 [Halieaceae bacterium]|jgi:hypothetical protein|nr:hypothetical protein [Halieaceae bacterium]
MNIRILLWNCSGRRSAAVLAVGAAALIAGLETSAQVYKVTDEEEGVVFTDRPSTVSGGTVEKIEIREPNQAEPPPKIASPSRSTPRSRSGGDTEAAAAASVSITSPADESTIAMGPGNFAVSAEVSPPLRRGETLTLLVDGQAYGPEQQGTSWFVEGALRGPHDLVVRRSGRSGSTATSDPVRVYVLRPSIARPR